MKGLNQLEISSSGGCNSFGRWVCVCVCVSLSWVNGQTYAPEFWHEGQVEGYLGLVQRSRSPGQKTFFFNEMYRSDTAASTKRLMQMKPGFLPISDPACRIALYVEFNFIYECWGYDVECFQSVCSFFSRIKPIASRDHIEPSNLAIISVPHGILSSTLQLLLKQFFLLSYPFQHWRTLFQSICT